MVEKLNYLDQLKSNMGEEMADMMSDEITKVIDEQHSIEMDYAQLVEQRDQLKGITNKHRLEETKEDIMVSVVSNDALIFHGTVTVSFSYVCGLI